MTEIQNHKPVSDPEERTLQFAKSVRLFVKTLPKTIANIEDGKQLINASGSAGANYREANEALSRKDFVLRIKICRKEAKESLYWLRLIHETNELKNANRAIGLMEAANKLKKIFSSILAKSKWLMRCTSYLNFGHWVLDFEIYLLSGGCDLGFLDPPTSHLIPVHQGESNNEIV